MESEEAVVHMREDNPNIVSFFLSLLGPNVFSPNNFFPFNKGVGAYDPTQSNYYNINLRLFLRAPP